MSEEARAFWSLDELARLSSGRWLGDAAPEPDATQPFGVSIDSRTIAPGQVFIAIRGERFDGHDFAQTAADRGAAIVIADAPTHAGVLEASQRVPVLVVDDARRTLKALASAYRDRLNALVIGVTGSNGKTSTVRMIDAVFRGAAWRTASAIKSFNNDIGVPLTILNAPPDIEALICEIGMNNPGEIATLGEIVRPHAAIVTSIGHAHVGRLGSVSAIAREKLSLLKCVSEWPQPHPAKPNATVGKSGLALVPALGAEPAVVDLALDDLHEEGVLEGLDLRRVRAGDGQGVRWRLLEPNETGVLFTVEDDALTKHNAAASTVFRVPMLGAVMAGNAALAVTLGRWAGLDDAAIVRGLAATAGAAGRMTATTHTRDGVTIQLLDDCYNASPESMRAALLEATRQARAMDATQVLILGTMSEMGDFEQRVHQEIGRTLIEESLLRPGDAVIGVGEPTRWIIEQAQHAPGIETACFPAVTDELHEAVAHAIESRTTAGQTPLLVLIKGSRSVGLEHVAERLTRS